MAELRPEVTTATGQRSQAGDLQFLGQSTGSNDTTGISLGNLETIGDVWVTLKPFKGLSINEIKYHYLTGAFAGNGWQWGLLGLLCK